MAVKKSLVFFLILSAHEMQGKLLGSRKACEPIGVKDVNTIPDGSMTASSFAGIIYRPYYGRLHVVRGWGAWCPRRAGRPDYLQVDMGAVRSVCAVETQGEEEFDEWTTSFKLQFSLDGVTWNAYKENNAEKLFPGNTNGYDVVHNTLITDVQARFVRFYPVGYEGFPCMRVEISARTPVESIA